jgi:hypothetical protein
MRESLPRGRHLCGNLASERLQLATQLRNLLHVGSPKASRGKEETARPKVERIQEMIEAPAESPDQRGNASHSQILQERVGYEGMPSCIDEPLQASVGRKGDPKTRMQQNCSSPANINQYRSRPHKGPPIAAKACRHSGSRMNRTPAFRSNACCSAASTRSSTRSSSASPQRGQRIVGRVSNRAPHCRQRPPGAAQPSSTPNVSTRPSLRQSSVSWVPVETASGPPSRSRSRPSRCARTASCCCTGAAAAAISAGEA